MITAVDFETQKIEPRNTGRYPPAPVGVALVSSVRQEYLAWGHLTGNNCTYEQARGKLKRVYEGECVFHNSAFDLEVSTTYLCIPEPPIAHDTLYQAFLLDPRAWSLELKPLAEKFLKLKPIEQALLKRWILENIPEAKDSDWGAHISQAPGNIVAPYAIGDGVRTLRLFELFKKMIAELDRRYPPEAGQQSMEDAYWRELRLRPVIMQMEKRGIRTDTKRLKRDVPRWRTAVSDIDKQIITKLGGKKTVLKFAKDGEFNIGSKQQLANALESAGLVENWKYTEKGNRSLNKENLAAVITDQDIAQLITKRELLLKYISTYGEKWIASGELNDGFVFPHINQVRNNEEGGDSKGARTGRLSYSDSWQAIPAVDRLPFADLPVLRDYVIPDDPGQVIALRDYCFSADTEVLTDQGWKLFKDLDHNEMLAQWRDDQVKFARPTSYQKVNYTGLMVHIFGKRFTDLLVSPNHRCLYLDREMRSHVVTADAYPIGGARQLHAGELRSGKAISKQLLILICAIQADAKVEVNVGEKCWRAVFGLKKKRKTKRLIACLHSLKIQHDVKLIKSKPGFTAIRIYALPRSCVDFFEFQVRDSNCAAAKKSFKLGTLLQLDLRSRQFFLKELRLWDGTSNGATGWSYTTTTKDCADVVQAIAAVSNFRCTMNVSTLQSKKKFYGLGFSSRTNNSHTDTFTRMMKKYSGYIYCVTMPWSTVIVRRNGRTMITGQSQQEFRILAHYEGGPLLARYRADPSIDMHEEARRMIEELTSILFDRRPVKDTGFGLIYGMGLAKTARKTGQDLETAKLLRDSYLRAIPGLKRLIKEIKTRCKAGDPIRTWGGRLYWVEEPRVINGELRTFEYKMINVLIQSSAGDNTKESLIRINAALADLKGARLLLTAHDENALSVPKAKLKQSMVLLRETMESVEFDVLMKTDGKWSPRSWGSLKKYKD